MAAKDGGESSEEGSTLSSFQALASFLLSLTNNNGDGRIIISRTRPTCSRQGGGYLKYVMLTGEKIFSEVCPKFSVLTILNLFPAQIVDIPSLLCAKIFLELLIDC